MPLIDAHEIFSRYHMCFLTGSHFAQILKVVLLSILLSLEAQYLAQLCTQSWATCNQKIIYLVYIVLKLKLFFRNFTFENLHFSRSDMKSARFHA